MGAKLGKKITWREPLRGWPGVLIRRQGKVVVLGKRFVTVEVEEKQWDPKSCTCEVDCTKGGTNSMWWTLCQTKKPHTVTFQETLNRELVTIL